MSDSDYIPWKYRDTKRADQIDKSHAVADDVMRELAEALRHMVGECCIDYGEYCCAKMVGYAESAEATLARFDALGGNDE